MSQVRRKEIRFPNLYSGSVQIGSGDHLRDVATGLIIYSNDRNFFIHCIIVLARFCALCVRNIFR